MIKRKRTQILLASFTIMVLLVIAATLIVIRADVFQSRTMKHVSELSFQEYLWYENSFILLTQIGLMLAGALSVSAIMPAPEEENNPE